MPLRNVLLSSAIALAPMVATAQPVSGLYVGAGAGFNYLQDLNVTNYRGEFPNGFTVGGRDVKGAKLKGDGGPVVSLSVGYGLGNGLRLEVQGDYRSQHETFGPVPNGPGNQPRLGGGQLLTYGGFINALYDLNLGLPVVPYVGLGVGYEVNTVQNVHLYRNYFNGSNQLLFNENTQGSVAGQAIVGAAFPIDAIPGLSLTAEYRFMALAQPQKVHGAFTATSNGVDSPVGTTQAVGSATAKFDNEFNHAIIFGVRYAFGVAPPPPPPAPVPVSAQVAAPARTYLVFFDWDRADLTARARQIIAEAASNATKVQTTRIEVNGYTDRSGTPAYNQKLSVRRADSVAAELVRDGIPRNEIVTMGFGESHPLVPTAAGVREPQNRRVEIILK